MLPARHTMASAAAAPAAGSSAASASPSGAAAGAAAACSSCWRVPGRPRAFIMPLQGGRRASRHGAVAASRSARKIWGHAALLPLTTNEKGFSGSRHQQLQLGHSHTGAGRGGSKQRCYPPEQRHLLLASRRLQLLQPLQQQLEVGAGRVLPTREQT